MLELAITIGIVASFIISLLSKVGTLRWVQVESGRIKYRWLSELVYELVSCIFCISFWLCLILSIVVDIATGGSLSVYEIVFLAILATPISKLLV